MQAKKQARELSDKAVAVLSLISEGHSYHQIVDGHPEITYKDTFDAAAEALELAGYPTSAYHKRLAEIRAKYPRAYEPWTQGEDKKLEQLHGAGAHVREIAEQLQRQPSAIESRLKQRGLVQIEGSAED
jgi:hypothetical protein